MNIKTIASAFFVVSVLVIFSLIPMVDAVTVRDEAGTPVIVKPVCAGDEVVISFMHSVEKVPVIDGYVVGADGKLLLKYGKYGSMSAGLPSDVSNNITYTDDGFFLIDNIDRPMEEVLMRVCVIPRYNISISGEKYPLYEMVSDGTLVSIKIEKISPIFLLYSAIKA